MYLVEQYDDDSKISFETAPEKHLAQQWLAFQISGTFAECIESLVFHTDWLLFNTPKGQGPYFGQATWFARFHAEKLQSAIDRYVDEILRVTGVLDRALETNGTGWLVGNSLTYADLSFITWASVGKGLLKELSRDSELDKYPNYTSWIKAMEKRGAVKKIQDSMAKGRAANGL